MSLKIAILGIRGIPNYYGGYEQITEHLSAGLVEKGHEVTVYNSHNHPYRENSWKGVRIVHCYDPEYLIGTAGQFVYDLNCILHARRAKYDIILQLGYTSSSVWGWLYPAQTVVVSNMDGMEWKRAKYSKKVRNFLRYAEALAVRYSHYHIADSEVIKTYLDQKYQINSKFIPYGAALLHNRDITGILDNYGLQAQRYFLLMARMEPENNIEMILDGFQFAATTHSFVVIGNINNKYGRYLVEKYRHNPRIVFLGGVFNASIVHALKAGSLLYFHGHSVGGTNPSLLEAMASRALIAAHNNPFNATVLGDHAFFFASANDVQLLVETVERNGETAHMIEVNYQKITEEYTWNRIVDQYETFLYQCYKIRGIREPVIRHLHEVKHIK